MVRSPAELTRRTLAPKLHSTGAVSEDDTAQQRELPGATRQMSPSFFMQHPIPFRSASDRGWRATGRMWLRCNEAREAGSDRGWPATGGTWLRLAFRSIEVEKREI